MVAGTAELAALRRRRSRLVGFLSRMLREKPLGTFGLIVTLMMILTAVFAGQLSPYDYDELTTFGDIREDLGDPPKQVGFVKLRHFSCDQDFPITEDLQHVCH